MWPDSLQTQELLNQAHQGKRAAVDDLLARHREPLRRMIHLRIDPAIAGRLDASDIVQEVLFEVSRRLDDYLRKPDMPFHLWLRHIAKDHVIDAHRRHHRAQKRSVDREQRLPLSQDHSSLELVAQLINPELTPASAAIRQEIADRFQGALAALNDDDREIILMRHFEQLSNQDVAVALNLTGSAAAMRYLRALRRLRKLLHPRQSY